MFVFYVSNPTLRNPCSQVHDNCNSNYVETSKTSRQFDLSGKIGKSLPFLNPNGTIFINIKSKKAKDELVLLK